MAALRRSSASYSDPSADGEGITITLLPELTEDEREDLEQQEKLDTALAEARAAIIEAAQAARELGFPMTRSLRWDDGADEEDADDA